MNLIDTADVYGFDWGGTGFGQVEEILGGSSHRHPACATGWCWRPRAGSPRPRPTTPRRSTCARRARPRCAGCRAEVIDLYQIHRPDLFTHPADVAVTLDRAPRRGQDPRGRRLQPHARPGRRARRPTSSSRSSPTSRSSRPSHLDPIRDGTLDQCMELRIVPMAWSPLGRWPPRHRATGPARTPRRARRARRARRRRPGHHRAGVRPRPPGRAGRDHRLPERRPHPLVDRRARRRPSTAATCTPSSRHPKECPCHEFASPQPASPRSRGSARCATTTTSSSACPTRRCAQSGSTAATSS